MRKQGLSEQEATKPLLGKSVSQKNEFLFQLGINFNDIPSWQKRGVGLYWENDDKPAINAVMKEEVVARRRRIRANYDLPIKNQCGELVASIILQPHTEGTS